MEQPVDHSILGFFERSVGKWFSQRTRYQLGQTQQWHRSDKTHLFQEVLPGDASEVIHLCNLHHLDAHLALGGLRSSWEKSLTQAAGSLLLVPLRDPNALESGIPQTGNIPQSGKLLRAMHGGAPTVADYAIGKDGSLTIQIATKTAAVEERLEFAAPNLRLRTCLISAPGQPAHLVAFYSEIRLGSC